MLRLIDLRRGDPPPGPTRIALAPEVVETARAICLRVRDDGDAALLELTRELDGVDVAGRMALGPDQLEDAAPDPAVAGALDRMAERLRELHGRQLPAAWEAERDGIRFGERVLPVAAAGCYVPGGRAGYPSSVLMTAIPARVAGVETVVVCTPPGPGGSVSEEVRYAARVAGVDAVFLVGGAQAIAAMAYGTATVPPVDLIVGPGNAHVTAAKREVAGLVGIDMLAGPTELVLVAGPEADPALVAADLVAQAEHDPDARAVLVCLEDVLPERVERALAAEVAASPRRSLVEASLAGSCALIASDEAEAAGVVDRLAPEHLQVVTEDPGAFLDRVRSYGAAFLGPRTAVSLGDYGAGSNHVLPTMATARFSSGLRASAFVTVRSFIEASSPGAAAIGPEIEAVARAEGLAGHARASEVRR